MIELRDFQGYPLYTLSSDELQVSVTALGATVTQILYRGGPVALGYATAAEYLAGKDYLGAIVGRYANRIGGAAFTLGGRRYALRANENGNTLHGAGAFDKALWQGEIRGDSLRLTLRSPDGEMGFPGNLQAAVTYTVEGSALRLDFEGESDADTVYCPTTHLYFNLDGSEDIRGHVLQLKASGWLETDGELIPTGTVCPAEGDFDFSEARPLGRDFDHCFLLSSPKACRFTAGGIALELETDYPAMQLYTGSGLNAPHHANSGFAIEPEFCPDCPNQPALGSALLKAGEHFHKYAVYTFSEV